MVENKNRKELIYEYLQKSIATCAMVCDALGIKEKYFTRIKREFEKNDRLWVLKKGRCQSTGYRSSQYVTTNPDLKPIDPQLSLFD